MKQSPLLAPLGTPLAIRLANNSNVSVSATNASGVTYVLQQQQSKPGVLRPLSFVPQQQQQQNGGGGGVGASGGQVLIRRFPNNNVVHVRRIVAQHQQPQNRQPFQKVVVQQGHHGGTAGVPTVATTSSNNNGVPRPRQFPPSVSITASRGDGQGTSSEPESAEEPEKGEKTYHRNGKRAKDNNRELNGGNESDDANNYKKLLVSGKRKRVAVDDNKGGFKDEDDDEDLLVDQDGDVIEDDDGEEGEQKSALELNGAGVDTGFLRHVVETQILNRHKTRIKDWDGTRGNMCQSCHETFLSETGLETHRNRRIHHILFFCRYCKRDLSFFNKCRLLQHLRNHRVQPTVSSLQNCIMIRLLPESDYLHFKYEDCTSSSDDEEDKIMSSPVSTGGGNSSGNGSGGGPSKRLKPSRFRRIARSSVTGRDSDNSPPPNVSRQIVAPPQLSSPPLAAENSTTTIVPTLNTTTISSAATVVMTSTTSSNNNDVGAIKYANSSVVKVASPIGDDSSQQRASQVAVIKSTGKTTSLILPSASVLKTPEKESTPAAESSDSPQIRIRNLSQITVSVNDDEDNDNFDEFEGEDDDDDDDKLVIAPVMESPNRSSAAPVSENSTAPPPPVIAAKKEYRCYKCDKIFRLSSELFKHLEEAEQVGLSTRSLHRCPTDDIPSWSQCQYVFHTKVFHEKSVPFMCPGCGDESPDYNSLLEHVTNDCFYLSQRARYMCAATVAKCSFSDRKSVKTEPEIIDHLKKEHSRSVLQCLHCTQGFATDNWLLKHLSEAHGIQFDESKSAAEREALINKTTRPLTQCLICNILFPNGPTYLQHVYLNFHMHILHAKMLECQNCLAVFETHEEILTHRKENEACRKLDPFSMKISESSAGNDGSGGQMTTNTSMAPTPIKIVANPAAAMSAKPGQQPPQLTQIGNPRSHSAGVGHATVVAVISTATTQTTVPAKPPTLSPQVSMSRSQPSHQRQSANQPNSSQMIPASQQNNSRDVTQMANNNKNAAKKTIFDDLLSCQFCERLVVFSSLRKHEDQCCGLSTVDPGYCLTCKQYFGDKVRLARHGIVHIKEGLPICLFCNNRHIRPTHPKSTTPSAHENLYALKKHLYSNHTSKIAHFPYRCSICSAWCADKRACEFHIKDHQFKFRVKPDEPDPHAIDMSPEELQKMVKVRRKGVDPRKKATTKTIEVYYCPVCKNREFALESGLSRHLKLVHQKNPKSLNLSLLKKASTARRFVVKAPETAGSLLGMGMQHQTAKPLLRSVSASLGSSMVSIPTSKGRNGSTANASGQGNNAITVSSSSGSNSFISRFSSSIVLRKRLVSSATGSTSGRKLGNSGGNVPPQRQLPNTRQRSASTTSSNPSSNSNTRPPSNFLQTRLSSTTPSSSNSLKSCRGKDGTITCLKCPEFSCKSENEFCEHVKWNHVWPDSEIQKLKFGNKLEEPSEYWCPECNTMFVAKPSLVRHLKFAHDYISSVDDYMQKIGYDGKKPLKPHQCDVCYYQCADDREHQQHIRTHGMAFLRLRQQRQLSMTKK